MEYRIIRQDELYHHGIKGMRWGHRKIQESRGLRKKGYTTGDIVGHHINKQLSIAKSERKRHTTAGHILSAIGKNAIHGMAIGIPLGLVLGPRVNNPAFQTGARVAGALLTANYAAEAGARIYYKHTMPKSKKRSRK